MIFTHNAEQVFKSGYKAGIRALAVWNDGQQFVGVMKVPLEDFLFDIECGRCSYYNMAVRLWRESFPTKEHYPGAYGPGATHKDDEERGKPE